MASGRNASNIESNLSSPFDDSLESVIVSDNSEDALQGVLGYQFDPEYLSEEGLL